MKILKKLLSLLGLLAAILPGLILTVQAQETCISIEITDTQNNSDSVSLSDGQITWSGIVSLIEEPETVSPQNTVIFEDAANLNSMPLYFQNHYPNIRYGSGTIASSGCSITCLAMVASYMTDYLYSPDVLADYFGGSAFSNIDRLEAGSDALQLSYRKAVNWHETLQALEEGKVVIALMEEDSLFTESQHFIVLTGMTADGKILVNDPNLTNYAQWDLQRGFANGFTENDILKGYSGGWIYDKEDMPKEPFLYREEKVERQCRYPGLTLTNEDIDLLARVVWVEAQGESFEGQQAVAEVALNRLVSGDFPNTMQDVIYGEGQFRSVPYLEDAEPWQTQYDAIESALYGPYVLPMDVMYFAQEATNSNVWGRIGGHVFCY